MSRSFELDFSFRRDPDKVNLATRHTQDLQKNPKNVHFLIFGGAMEHSLSLTRPCSGRLVGPLAYNERSEICSSWDKNQQKLSKNALIFKTQTFLFFAINNAQLHNRDTS